MLRLMVGLDDLKRLFQPKQFYGSMILGEVLESTDYWALEQRYKNWAVSDKVDHSYASDGIYMYVE